jgi:hypothetical protein
MKKAITVILLFSVFVTFAQNVTKDEFDKVINPLNDKVGSLQLENSRLKEEVKTLESKLSSSDAKIEDLQKQTTENSSAIIKKSEELGLKISSTENNSNQRFSAFEQSLSKKSLWSIIGVLLAILISGAIYWLLSKRQESDKSEVIGQLNKTKDSIEVSIIKEFGKQTESMENQLQLLIEQQRTAQQIVPSVEPDHSLALKVASEINLIERNVKLMDIKTKGLKQLIASIGKLKDNLAANGYEMPELIGKQFHQGMKVIVTSSIPDDNLEKGSELITKVLIPQVNFNDKMIQTAQIEVSVG